MLMKLREYTQFIQDTKCTNQLKTNYLAIQCVIAALLFDIKPTNFHRQKEQTQILPFSHFLCFDSSNLFMFTRVSSPYVVTEEVSFHFGSKIIPPTSNILILNSNLTRCRNHHEICGEVQLHSSKI